MFWFSFGNGGRGGCFVLPLFFFCGSFYMFGGARGSSLLMPLLLAVVVWLVMSSLSRSRFEDNRSYEDEKPKRDKPKRGGNLIVGDDGELFYEDDDSRANSRNE